MSIAVTFKTGERRESTLVGYAPAPDPGLPCPPGTASPLIDQDDAAVLGEPDSRGAAGGPLTVAAVAELPHDGDRRNPLSRRQAINRGRDLSRRFFDDGERQQRDGWKNSPLVATEPARDPAVDFRSFDEVPSRRGPLLLMTAFGVVAVATVAWGVGQSWRPHPRSEGHLQQPLPAHSEQQVPQSAREQQPGVTVTGHDTATARVSRGADLRRTSPAPVPQPAKPSSAASTMKSPVVPHGRLPIAARTATARVVASRPSNSNAPLRHAPTVARRPSRDSGPAPAYVAPVRLGVTAEEQADLSAVADIAAAPSVAEPSELEAVGATTSLPPPGGSASAPPAAPHELPADQSPPVEPEQD